MKKWKRILGLLLCFAMLASGIGIKASAASYPLVSHALESSQTIPEGETGLIRLTIMPEYKNEAYHVEVYNSSGRKVASAENTYYNVDGTFVKYVNISINTADMGMGVGTYTVKYWTSFYSFFEWHDSPNKYTYTLKVIQNKCKGNHNLVLERVVSEGTCEKEGTVKMYCTKCEYTTYEKSWAIILTEAGQS